MLFLLTDRYICDRLLGEAVYPLKDLVRLGAQEATVPLRDRDGKVGEVGICTLSANFCLLYLKFYGKEKLLLTYLCILILTNYLFFMYLNLMDASSFN